MRKKSFYLLLKERLNGFKSIIPEKNSALNLILKKFGWQMLTIFFLIITSLFIEFFPFVLKKQKEKPLSIDKLIPKKFVLLPIDLINGQDIIPLIGAYGVVDLYVYSEQRELPHIQAASEIKILPPNNEEGLFAALIPENEAFYLMEYSNSFYAVIQNPDKKNSKVYKKRKFQPLIVIEENF